MKCAALCLLTTLASAQTTDTTSLSDTANIIVVTASKRSQPSMCVTDNHQVISVENELRTSSKNAVEQLVDRVPVRYSDYGGGTAKSLSLMGAGTERTLVLVDGKRMGTADGDLGDVSPDIISKIEVINGGQSALYGMDAVGGVINIITKKPAHQNLFGTVSSTIASFEPRDNDLTINTFGLSGSAGRRTGPFGWLVGADRSRSDGRFEYANNQNRSVVRENDSTLDQGVFATADYTAKQLAVGITGSYRQRNAGIPGTTAFPAEAHQDKNIGFVALDGSYELSRLLKLKLNYAFNYDSIHYVDPNIYFPQDSRHARRNQTIECVQELTFDKQKITTGIQGYRQSMQSNEIGDHTANQGSVFASGILEHSAGEFVFSATPSARYDYSSIYNGAANGKISLLSIWNTGFHPGLFFTIGNSYRSPSFNDLYWPADAYAAGNPDLKPETSLSIDGGIRMQHRLDKFSISCRASAFRMRLTDMIAWQEISPWFYSPRNIADAMIRGASLKINIDQSSLYRTALDFTYNQARDNQSHLFLAYKPEYVMIYSNALASDRFSAGITCRYSGKVFTDAANTKTMPSTVRLDANAGLKVYSFGSGTGSVRVAYDILNIFNEQLATNEGYPLPGREHRLGLKIGF
ncbi:MAG: TonB-dependent receptor [Chitinispirillaceae bacterium]|nr:TonB-dependent receptor [Chitinispirillaceae bacterium]